MLVTDPDITLLWPENWNASPDDPEAQAILASLPAGAKEVRAEWVFQTRQVRRESFDRSMMSVEVISVDEVTEWRSEADPRVRNAGALHLDRLGASRALLERLPGVEVLGESIRAVSLDGETLGPGTLAHIGSTRPWEDLAISERPGGAAGELWISELVNNFPALQGLDLNKPGLNKAELHLLAAAPFTPQLRDLSLTMTHLDPRAMVELAEALGDLDSLSLRDSRRAPGGWLGPLASKLGKAELLDLSSVKLGDEGLELLLQAGALEGVRELYLNDCRLTARSLKLLAQAHPARLQGLWLSGNDFADASLADFMSTPLFDQLQGASFMAWGDSPLAQAKLQGHPLEECLVSTARKPGSSTLWLMGRPTGRSGPTSF